MTAPDAPLLQFDIGQPSPDTVVVELFGEVDLSTQSRLAATLGHVLEGWPQHVIVGLDHVDFLSAGGLHELVSAHDHARQHDISFVLAAPTPLISRVLAITGVDATIPVHPTTDSALIHA